ncbi:MAG: hypothetical protein LUD41_08180, partial [Phascolarctobacterium sp.]|nr:hypothetical protein [Phascolarctobacterium sp.]
TLFYHGFNRYGFFNCSTLFYNRPMKKILGLMFILMLSCQARFALEPPALDDTNWVMITENDNFQFWVDTENISFTEEEDGTNAYLWQMIYRRKSGISGTVYTEMKLNADMVRYVEIYSYDKKRKT